TQVDRPSRQREGRDLPGPREPPGQTYELRFWIAGNPEGGPAIKRMAILWNGEQVAIRHADSTGHTDTDMGWQRHRLTLTATATTTRLEFQSLTPGAFGPVIDKVAVGPIA